MENTASKSPITDWESTDFSTTRYGRVSFDLDKCNGCTWCVQACPAKSLEMIDKKPQMIEKSECMFCGNCQAICSRDAVALSQVPEWPGFFTIIDRGKPSKPRLTW